MMSSGYLNAELLSRGKTLSSRLLQTWRLLRVLGAEFQHFLFWLASTSIVSVLLLYFYYPKQELPAHHYTILGFAYDTMLMTFFESPIPFVDDWRLVPIFFGLPILGLLVIAEGVVHFGSLIVHHKRYTKEWQKMLASTYENHIVVCGLGNVGFRVVEHLKRYEQDVVCIEHKTNSQFVNEIEQLKVPVIDGDATSIASLELAGVKRAKAVIAVTDNDLANLEIALNARELRPGIRAVVRMFDQRLAKKIEKSFGISCAFSTSALSAPIFAQSALSENILASFEFGNTTVNAFQFIVDEEHGFIGLKIDDLRHRYEVTILMHERNQHVDWNPPPNTILEKDDKLLLLTDNVNVRELFRSTAAPPR